MVRVRPVFYRAFIQNGYETPIARPIVPSRTLSLTANSDDEEAHRDATLDTTERRDGQRAIGPGDVGTPGGARTNSVEGSRVDHREGTRRHLPSCGDQPLAVAAASWNSSLWRMQLRDAYGVYREWSGRTGHAMGTTHDAADDVMYAVRLRSGTCDCSRSNAKQSRKISHIVLTAPLPGCSAVEDSRSALVNAPRSPARARVESACAASIARGLARVSAHHYAPVRPAKHDHVRSCRVGLMSVRRLSVAKAGHHAATSSGRRPPRKRIEVRSRAWAARAPA